MVMGKLKVKGSKISGEGEDEVGRFEFIGFYHPDGRCRFIKQYKGAHQVNYEGRREGQTIHGQWEVQGTTGGFRMWKERKWAGHYV